MKVTSKPMALIIFIAIFGGIGLTSAVNLWQDGSSRTPRTLTQGETAGQYDPADIRGSSTFGEVSSYFNIPLEVLKAAFHVSAEKDITGTPLKDMADFAPDMSPHSVGMFAAFYNGLPFDPGEEAYLSSDAAAILIQHGKLTPEQRAYLDAHTLKDIGVRDGQITPTILAVQTIPAETKGSNAPKTITGTTTFQDLLDWGMSKETIEKIIGAALPDVKKAVRDYISDQGLEFRSYKDSLQAELNKGNP